jgi:Lon protease-like protein
LPLCEVRLAPGLQINCRARVCAFRLARSPYRGTRIHLEFVDLPDTKRAQLKVFLERLSQNLEEKAQSQAA